MSKFKVGDVCEITNAKNVPRLLGCECTVVSPLEDHMYGGKPIIAHRVSVAGEGSLAPWGLPWLAQPHQLRLKRPPSWDKWLYDTREVRDEQGQPA